MAWTWSTRVPKAPRTARCCLRRLMPENWVLSTSTCILGPQLASATVTWTTSAFGKPVWRLFMACWRSSAFPGIYMYRRAGCAIPTTLTSTPPDTCAPGTTNSRREISDTLDTKFRAGVTRSSAAKRLAKRDGRRQSTPSECVTFSSAGQWCMADQDPFLSCPQPTQNMPALARSGPETIHQTPTQAKLSV